MDDYTVKKAKLIEAGGVAVDGSFRQYVTKATAGPGAGLESIFVSMEGHLVRVGVRSSSPYKASVIDGDVVIFGPDGKELLKGRLTLPVCHCPGQAYITVSERCVFDCKFCPVPKLQGRIKTKEEVVDMVEKCFAGQAIKAISITSGVWKTPEEEVARIADIVKGLTRFNVPIGVSVYPAADSSEILKAAGAAEIKYNVETVDPVIFAKVCPGLSLDHIISALEHAVTVFGRNSVFTNIIIGLGESDETVLTNIDHMAGKGIIPILRKVNPHPLRKGEIFVENVSAERLLRLAAEERRILDKHGLRADLALTGCLLCTGCDITPHRDI